MLVYDSLGDSTNSQFTWTKVAANNWSLAVTPPAGAAVATLYNNSSAVAGPLVYSSQGQLEFNSLPPDGSYLTVGSGSNSQTNPLVQIQFYNSSKGQSNPTSDTPQQISVSGDATTQWVSTLGVDLNGITGTSTLTGQIVKSIQTAANSPYTIASTGAALPAAQGGPTLNISSVLLGGMSDGASRFVADGSTLQIVQEPGANALNINVVSNAATGLGSSIVESGANGGTAGPGGTTLGQFTVAAIWSGGPVGGPDPNSYSQLVAGTKSMTVNSYPPTGYFQVGNEAIAWSDINGGSGPITLYTVTPGNPPTYNVDTSVGGGTGQINLTTPAAGAVDQLSLAQNLQTILPQLASVPAFAGLTVSNVSGTSGNPATLTLSDLGTAAQIIPDATDGTNGVSGEVTWSDGTDGLQPELLGPTGVYASDATGISFNGDGTPAAGSGTGLSNALPGIIPTSMTLTWANGAENSVQNPAPNTAQQPQIALDFGSPNETNGMTQLGGDYNVNFLQQNGAKFGNFAGVSIASNGTVTALFDNGVRTPVFQIPVATFPNPDGMESLSGNVFIDTTTSGSYTVRQAGTGGSGTVAQSSLEASTVDLGTQFTTMITVQRAYSAAAKVITTTNSMLSDLIQIIPQ